jgi:general secretion pathway protein B
MSLILEALKKSERQRRLGESPSIGSPVMAVRRRRSLLPPLIGLIAIALVAVWWFNRAPPAPPVAATAASPVASPTAELAPTEKPTRNASTFDDHSQAAGHVPEPAKGTAAERLPRSRTPADATASLRPDLREKIKSGELVVANPQLLKPGEPATIKESEAMPAPAGTKTAPPAAKPASTSAPAASIEKIEHLPASAKPAQAQPQTPVKTIAPPPAPTPAATPPPAAPHAAAPAAQHDQLALIWELPYAVRRELPEIKLTMHVFANEPAQRFVIVNGNRHVEGDEVDGLKLIEIRNDGIVFENKGQRFLYPRGGR